MIGCEPSVPSLAQESLQQGSLRPDIWVMASSGDTVMDALDSVIDTLHDARGRLTLIEERAVEIKRRRVAGQEYLDIFPLEERPLIVALLAETITLLHEASGQFRREEARALHTGGVTMDEIAALFGVTRQRISEVLRSRPDTRRKAQSPSAEARSDRYRRDPASKR